MRSAVPLLFPARRGTRNAVTGVNRRALLLLRAEALVSAVQLLPLEADQDSAVAPQVEEALDSEDRPPAEVLDSAVALVVQRAGEEVPVSVEQVLEEALDS